MLPSWCAETITVLRAPTVSARGTQVADWAHAVPHTVAGCSVQVSSTSMDLDGRTETEQSGIVYAPPGADIKAGDRITAAAGTYLVDGDPMPWRSPTSRVSHLQVRIVRYRG